MSNLIYWPQIAGPVAGQTPLGHDPFFSSVVMLSHFDNNTTNYASLGSTWTNGSPAPSLSSVQSKFGGFSLRWTGATQRIFSTSGDYALGTGDATIEFWTYLAGVTTGQNLIDFRTVSNQPTPTIYVVTGTVRYFSSNADRITSGASAISVNTWTAIAWSRVSGTSRLFINGSQVGSDFADTQNSASNSISLTSESGTGNIVDGYIDEVRVTKGVGRYTTNYSVQTAPFPNQ